MAGNIEVYINDTPIEFPLVKESALYLHQGDEVQHNNWRITVDQAHPEINGSQIVWKVIKKSGQKSDSAEKSFLSQHQTSEILFVQLNTQGGTVVVNDEDKKRVLLHTANGTEFVHEGQDYKLEYKYLVIAVSDESSGWILFCETIDK